MRVAVVPGKGPTDRIALEIAVRLGSGGETFAVAVGEEHADEVLRVAVAAGCERAIRVDGDDHDQWIVAQSLESPMREIAPDLLLVGARSGRLGVNLVGPMLAERLDQPHVGPVASIEGTDMGVRLERRSEGLRHTIKCPLPAVVSVEWGPRLRYPTLANQIRARTSTISTQPPPAQLIPRTEVTAATGPKPRRKLPLRSAPAIDYVVGMLLGGVGAGGPGMTLEGEGGEVVEQIVAACLQEMGAT